MSDFNISDREARLWLIVVTVMAINGMRAMARAKRVNLNFRDWVKLIFSKFSSCVLFTIKFPHRFLFRLSPLRH
jgi:hypothetical protein